MSYWKHYGWRYALLIGVMAWGYSDSGFSGMLWALLGFGVLMFVLYTILDAGTRVTRAFDPEADRFESRRRSDTQPTVDDYMGMIESYKHRRETD